MTTRTNTEHAADLAAILKCINKAKHLAEKLDARPITKRGWAGKETTRDYRDYLTGTFWGLQESLLGEISWYTSNEPAPSWLSLAEHYETGTLLDAVCRGFVYRKTLRGACRWASRDLYGTDEHTEALRTFFLANADEADLADLTGLEQKND